MAMGFEAFDLVPLNCDNTKAHNIAENPISSCGTKHMTLCFFFLREVVKRDQITIHHEASQVMLADITTKHLSNRIRCDPAGDQGFQILGPTVNTG